MVGAFLPWKLTQIRTVLLFREWLLNITSAPLRVDHHFLSLIPGRSDEWILEHFPPLSTDAFSRQQWNEFMLVQGIQLTQ